MIVLHVVFVHISASAEIMNIFFSFYAGGLQWAMGMVFAVNEINENSSLLPMTTLGYAIYDSCFNMPKTVETSLKFMKIDSLHTKYCTYHVIVGTFGSTLAVMMARLFGLYSIPQVRIV